MGRRGSRRLANRSGLALELRQTLSQWYAELKGSGDGNLPPPIPGLGMPPSLPGAVLSVVAAVRPLNTELRRNTSQLANDSCASDKRCPPERPRSKSKSVVRLGRNCYVISVTGPLQRVPVATDRIVRQSLIVDLGLDLSQ